jgi:uncharacterized protein (DUF488 family)
VRAVSRIYTIGHSRHTIEQFVELLHRHAIALVVDVRSQPYSKWSPQFRREPLEGALNAHGLAYLFAGRELGGRPPDAYRRPDGSVDYDLRRRADDFVAGIDRLIALAERDRCAIMCAEEDPTHCHRSMLIAPALVERGVELAHLRKDGAAHGPAATQLGLFD